jgi:hypothetical protein
MGERVGATGLKAGRLFFCLTKKKQKDFYFCAAERLFGAFLQGGAGGGDLVAGLRHLVRPVLWV